MHNQYEWQHMLPEVSEEPLCCSLLIVMFQAVATVCSIKDNEVGHLRLSESGMADIGDCPLTNFHPHRQQPPLWEVAQHVITDSNLRVTVRDLR